MALPLLSQTGGGQPPSVGADGGWPVWMTPQQIQNAIALGYTPATVANLLPMVSGQGVGPPPTDVLPGSVVTTTPGGWQVQTASQAAWANTPQEYINLLEQLEHEWEALVGFRVPVTQQDLMDMAQNNVLTLSDFGAFMWGRMAPDQQQSFPWAQFGLDKNQFHSAVLDFGSTFEDLTGQTATPDILAQALKQHYTASEWRQHLLHDATMLQTYGWLKFGMNFQTFQETKAQMAEAFGGTLSDTQGILQLTYLHQSRDTFAAEVRQPQAPAGQETEIGFETAAIR